ncbi:hypothetical protein SAMN02799622_01829 [Methylobacterium sp. UNC378MF]|nr:hypothetical protein SAMN02799622_01829 [Methylobacterium sp. UNC378MF]
MQVYIPAAAVGSSDVPVDPRPRSRTALRLIENAIGLLVEIPAALLVVAEVGVLLAGLSVATCSTNHSFGPMSSPASCSFGRPYLERWSPSVAPSTGG